MPTQLDATTVIAIVGLLVASLSLFLAVRRDRAAERVRVRMVIEAGESRSSQADNTELRVTFSNPERRTVTVQRAGLAPGRWRQARREFKGWDRKTPPPQPGARVIGFGGTVPAFFGGLTFEPGAPAQTVTARMFRVRGECFPKVATWVWCEDSAGGVHWQPIPKPVRAAIVTVKRHKLVPADDTRTHPWVSVEVDDTEAVDPNDVDVDSVERWG